MSVRAGHMRELDKAAERRSLAFQAYQDSLAELNDRVRAARAAGVPAIWIAEAIGTSRQRVYEVLREG